MPFINTKTNMEIPKEKEQLLKEKLGKAIECIPGKSEAWLMLNFEQSCHMYFKGSCDKPMAFIEVKIFGNASEDVFNTMTAKITEIINEVLSIERGQIYVKYEEVKFWGWNGSNF